MITLIQYLNDSRIPNYNELLIFDISSKTNIPQISHYICHRPCLTVMANVRELAFFERSCLLLIHYVFELNTRFSLFHGDLNPENVFIDDGAILPVITDSGTL